MVNKINLQSYDLNERFKVKFLLEEITSVNWFIFRVMRINLKLYWEYTICFFFCLIFFIFLYVYKSIASFMRSIFSTSLHGQILKILNYLVLFPKRLYPFLLWTAFSLPASLSVPYNLHTFKTLRDAQTGLWIHYFSWFDCIKKIPPLANELKTKSFDLIKIRLRNSTRQRDRGTKLIKRM